MKRNAIKKYDANILNSIGRDKEMLSLTDLWKAAGSDPQKAPAKWKETEGAKGFIAATLRFLNIAKNDIMKTRRGKSGGSYAHIQIALEYAQYLDSELAVVVNENFIQRLEEEKNPDLIVDRYVATYKRKGKSDEWIAKRLKGKVRRNEFTSCLAAHGVEKDGFRNCTNAIYNPLFGGTTAVIRAKKNLPKSVSIRDNMSETELLTVEFAEHLSKLTIEKEKIYGDARCEMACSRSSKIIANALIEHKNYSNI